MDAFADDEEKLESARLVRNIGELLTAMEVSAASRYWHVWGSKTDEDEDVIVSPLSASDTSAPRPHINTYPAKYSKPVVGMMHETVRKMMQLVFQETQLSSSLFCRTML